MILLSPTQAIRILTSPYPAFGITTITFMSLGSYGMLLGIYFSAIYVSQDSKLRQTISRSSDLSEQSKLLKNIGKSQMESEIQKNVRLTIKKISPRLEEESGIQVDWEENISDYIDMLLKEKEKMKKLRLKELAQLGSYQCTDSVGCNTLVYVIHFQGVRRDNLGLETGDLNLGMDLDKDLNLRTHMEIK